MCVSNGPAIFSGTTVFAGRRNVNGTIRHLLGYANTVQNLTTGGNAMIIGIPAKPGTLSAANIIDTRGAKNIFKDMAEAIRPKTRSMSRSMTMSFSLSGVQHIQFDVYDILSARQSEQLVA